MTRPYRDRQELNRLLGEFLALLESLGGSQCHVDGAQLLCLFAVDGGPLGLMAGREQGATAARTHKLNSIDYMVLASNRVGFRLDQLP
jgi:hypothetical protein